MGRYRKRSSSGGSFNEMSSDVDDTTSVGSATSETQNKSFLLSIATVKQYMQAIVESRHEQHGNQPNKSLVLHDPDNLAMLAAYVVRAQQLDASGATDRGGGSVKQKNNSSGYNNTRMQEELLLQTDVESHYTALHWALLRGEVGTILFLLRHAASVSDEQHQHSHQPHRHHQTNHGSILQQRLKHKPMALLEFAAGETTSNQKNAITNKNYNLWQKMVTIRDAEGATPAQLLALQQRTGLKACRQQLLPRPRIRAQESQQQQQRRPRQASFDSLHGSEEPLLDNDDESLEVLRRHGHLLNARNPNHEDDSSTDSENSLTLDTAAQIAFDGQVEYGCEVLTFGRAHHCALGVGTDGSSNSTHRASSSNNREDGGGATTFRPQRVQEFAQSRVGRGHSAVAVAAAAHHTLVLDRAGRVFSFGLGKGGRLGTGSERHSPLPTLLSSLSSRGVRVTAIAAAENHSLAVANGRVFAWGSNRFGQLGLAAGSSNNKNSSDLTTKNQVHDSASSSSSSSSCALVPRRVDDFRDVSIQGVAAGERHSVAMSDTGKLYVWGDNSSGQLGLAPRKSHQGGEKVQQCTALGNKTVVAVAASEFSTVVLTLPARDRRTTLPTNVVYAWGHGNHVPFKVQLGGNVDGRSRGNSMSADDPAAATRHRHNRQDSPIAIASAKFHNVAITQNGLVYTWGLHSETLGTGQQQQQSSGSKKKKTGGMMVASSAQLVDGMLPENGGGLAVAVSASENHTAILTDTGALYTWGATHGPDILGHEGVRFQSAPRKVPGLYRGVAVAAAKEHFVVLSGTSFPQKPKLPSSSVSSLESLAALRVTEFVDMFNVLPVLITAERTQNELLVQYCTDFCKRNLDGVLNVAQRSVMDCYLREQLQTNSLASHQWLVDEFEKRDEQDSRCHPFLKEFVLGLNRANQKPKFTNDALYHPTELSSFEEWLHSCDCLAQTLPAKLYLQKLLHLRHRQASIRTDQSMKQPNQTAEFGRRRARGVSFGEDHIVTVATCSPRCLELTGEANSSIDSGNDLLALEERQSSLMKETRAIKKRLNQIAKLEDEQSKTSLSHEQREKVLRKSQLQADLDKLEPALDKVESRIRFLALGSQTPKTPDYPENDGIFTSNTTTGPQKEAEAISRKTQSFRCGLCGITCSDESSYSLHMNGRKHRNRAMQAEHQEHERKAAFLAAEHQREAMKKAALPARENKPKTSSSPWKNEPQASFAQPKYKLPPPPHEIPSTLSSPQSPKKSSLRDIMATETRRSGGKKATPKPKHAQNSSSVPWLAPVARKSSKPSNGAPKALASPWKPLEVKSLPKLESPPWAVGNAAPRPAVPTAAMLTPPPRNGILSLNDFINPPTTSTPSKSKSPKVWTTAASSPTTPKFESIQNEEMAFKDKQDPVCGEQGKWFIQQRERAGSLKEIQKSDEQARQDRLFVEEQYRIENMIRAEAEEKRKEEEKTKAQLNRNNNKTKNKNNGGKKKSETRRRKPCAATKPPANKSNCES
uniref:C2H2-type domain-containing protein n=1 Tax=Entomoneis paludosa TaxID=265537 RepID=A0A7S2Y7H3_9STRA|mmetsp:Transcript_21118/g.44129  ORF Transcript_21118/g.44129 Transcript_21118/m.44129 type:complete len:1498 (+) Transcript_21118:55-4548(+)|eukprot:CAMPEP_0172468794 /NCGR_PEP_ID=MMETSP1065-20121228/62119_1 /TAXON_ID=265537 /ORGANISM="Amphiprora paludosa, Strain CCMP125" /LENGTH=1497 /DNA_ID=CAMNT_0013226259 /DNA_START=51 /DNA_END=4544 /DNA_ORIENTATION=+